MLIFNKDSFAKALVLERVWKRRITIGTMAGETGILTYKLTQYEQQLRKPNLDEVLILCEWLGIPIEKFIEKRLL